MNEALLALLIKETPGLIATARDLFVKHNPGEPVPTDEEILAGYEAAFKSSRDKDDAWLAAHPEKPKTDE